MRIALAGCLLALVGCAADVDDDVGEIEDGVRAEDAAGLARAFPEAVQILHDNGRDFCTGVLVGPRVALTAAHCIGGKRFTVRAPFARGAPSVVASRAEVMSWSFGDPAVRDLAVLVLDRPIALPQYAVMTDIGEEADRGRTFRGVAVGRKTQTRRGALVRTEEMRVASGEKDGYTTGLRTPFYSGGGDSGGPLFLVEDGKVTHRLVGVERQPEPSRDADYFTRVDGRVRAFVKAHAP